MDKYYIKLTKNDKTILKSFENMIDGLGTYLGEGYELVLLSLENLETSVVKIINGSLSGRKVGSPITDLTLQLLGQIENNESHPSYCYFNKSKNGALIRSTTIPITGENNHIIGLICVNFYTDTAFSSFLSQFIPNVRELAMINAPSETFSENIDELILNSINIAKDMILPDASISSVNKNKEIVSLLYQKGIFNLKDSVVKVAELLNISKNTVYMHIRNLNPR